MDDPNAGVEVQDEPGTGFVYAKYDRDRSKEPRNQLARAPPLVKSGPI